MNGPAYPLAPPPRAVIAERSSPRARVERDSLRLIETIYEQHARRFLRVALAIVGDPSTAEDVVQDAFAQAVSRRASFRGYGAAEGWIWRIVVNTARTRRRRGRIEARALERSIVPEETTESPAAADERLRRAIRRLPERQRLALF